MEINKSKFVAFLEGIVLKGDRQNREAVLTVGDTRLACTILSADSTTAIEASLGGAFPVEKEEWGIDNLPFLLDVVKTFKGETIEVEKVENKLSLTQGKQKALCILRDTQYINNTLLAEKLATLRSEEKSTFTLTAEIVKEIGAFLSSYKAKAIKVVGNGKELSIYIENNENSFEKTYDLEQKVVKFKASLGAPFVDIISSVKSDLIINPTGRALGATVKTDDMIINYFVALMKE